MMNFHLMYDPSPFGKVGGVKYSLKLNYNPKTRKAEHEILGTSEEELIENAREFISQNSRLRERVKIFTHIDLNGSFLGDLTSLFEEHNGELPMEVETGSIWATRGYVYDHISVWGDKVNEPEHYQISHNSNGFMEGFYLYLREHGARDVQLADDFPDSLRSSFDGAVTIHNQIAFNCRKSE